MIKVKLKMLKKIFKISSEMGADYGFMKGLYEGAP
jgi:hypothetical protein